MKNIFVVTDLSTEDAKVYLKMGSISTIIKEVRGRIFFDNNDLKMIGVDADMFHLIHTSVKKCVLQYLETNQFEAIFLIFKELGIKDIALIQGNYSAAIQHRNNGGSFESVENKLASVRVWINDTIKTWQ